MKKELNKIIIFIGYTVFFVGVVLSGASDTMEIAILLATINIVSVYLAILLSVPFIFAENKLLKNIGYSLIALSSGYALSIVLTAGIETGMMISSVGMLVMFLGALMRFIMICLNFFGFIKTADGSSTVDKSRDALNILAYYKELQNENILTDEEFEETKQKLLNDMRPKANTMDDIKKWKKLLDQKVINEEEFTAIKAEMLGK